MSLTVGPTTAEAEAEAESVEFYAMVPDRTRLLNPPVDDPFRTDRFKRMDSANPNYGFEFDGTNGNIKCVPVLPWLPVCTFGIYQRVGSGNPWYTFLELDFEQLDFTVDAAGNVVDAEVDAFHTARYENWDDDAQILIHRPVTSVTGTYLDGEISLTFGSSYSAEGPITTVAEMVLEIAPDPGY